METKHEHHDEQDASNTNEQTNDQWYASYAHAVHLFAHVHYKTTVYKTNNYTILHVDDAGPAVTIEKQPDNETPAKHPLPHRESYTITNEPPETGGPTLTTVTNETTIKHPAPYDLLGAIPKTDGRHTIADDNGVNLGIPTTPDNTSVIIPNIKPIKTNITDEITTRIENTVISNKPTCALCAINEYRTGHEPAEDGELTPDQPRLAINANAETLQGFYSNGTFCAHHADQLDPADTATNDQHANRLETVAADTTHIATVTASEAMEIAIDGIYKYNVQSITSRQ